MFKAHPFLKTNNMKKFNYTFILFFLAPIFLNSQNTSSLLVSAVEKLPDERMVVTQSIKIKNLEQINSEQLDYSPIFYKNGILFTSNRNSQKKNFWNRIFKNKSSNLFFAEKIKDGAYKNPTRLQIKFKGKLNEGAIAINEAGNLMIYAVNDQKENIGPDFVELKLYASKYQNGKWLKGEKLPVNCEECTTCHPALTSDAKTLYFASNQPGGFGGMDLYKSELIDGVWSNPVNLGSKINTAQNDIFPFINHEGTLYYSSNGKKDSENLDIYFSRKDNKGEWKEAINIGEPFNSATDDFGFYIEKDGLSGLFSSNREGGKGMDDLYFWRMDQSLEQALDPTPVKFTIIDEETGHILSRADVSLTEFADIKIKISESKTPVAFISHVNQAIDEMLGKTYVFQTDEYGNFYYDLKHDRNYLLTVEKENYATFRIMTTYNLLSGVKDIDIALAHPPMIEPEQQYKTLIDLAASEEMDEDILNKVNPYTLEANKDMTNDLFVKGQKITLDNIYYEFGEAELKAESATILDQTAQMLKNFPEMEIDLMAHTDARGDAVYNKYLSQQRANKARNYLISKGIEAKRVKAVGLGEEELLNDCFDDIDCSEEFHSQNRRTEIVITKINPANEIFVKKE